MLWSGVAVSGEERIIVEHSPPAPPTSISQHNMNLMLNLSVSCQSFYGLSDHHHGTEMIIAATAMGAHIIEKGVCLWVWKMIKM